MKSSSPRRDLLPAARWSIGLLWRGHRRLVTGILLANLLRGLMPAGLALTAKAVVDAVVTLSSQESPSLRLLWGWIALGAGLAIVDATARRAQELFMVLLQDDLDLDINTRILEHASRLDLENFESPELQDTMERARQNTAKNFIKATGSTLELLNHGIQILSLATVLVAIDGLFLPLLLVLVGPYLALQWRVSRSAARLEHSRATKRRWTNYFTRQLTTPECAPEISVFGLGPLLLRRYRTLMGSFLAQDRRIHYLRFLGDVGFLLIATLAAYGVLYHVTLMVLEQRVTVGDVAIFGGASLKLSSAFENAIRSLADAAERTDYVANLRTFLEIEPGAPRDRGAVLTGCRGLIEFRDVTFRYPGMDRPVLTGVSFTVRPGETVALVGENGSGKSTLVKLLLRVCEPQSGEIRIDGTDIRSIAPESLHSLIAVVFQDHVRHEASAFDNIAYGDWRRLLDDPESVERAGRASGVDEMIRGLPRGYRTDLGRHFGETAISGGQWQQMAIARAIARDAPILVLDEPSSNLDAAAERRLASRFAEISRGRTTLLISHRLSTISIADRIVVLEEGRVIESGTHAELVNAHGQYSSLYGSYRSH